MKTINKINIIAFLVVIATVTTVFLACNKDDSEKKEKDEQTISAKNFTMECEYENKKYVFYGNDISDVLQWDRYVDGKLDMTTHVFLNPDEIEVQNSSSDSYTIRTKSGENLIIYNLDTDNPHNLSFDIQGNSGQVVKYGITDKNTVFTNYETQLNNYNSKAAVPWPLVFAAACLIYTIVDYYCDNKIADDVAKCTADGKCSVVNSCSATCVDCTKR